VNGHGQRRCASLALAPNESPISNCRPDRRDSCARIAASTGPLAVALYYLPTKPTVIRNITNPTPNPPLPDEPGVPFWARAKPFLVYRAQYNAARP
jgi:hypothetical protein